MGHDYKPVDRFFGTFEAIEAASRDEISAVVGEKMAICVKK